jgi:hypothetical protein
MRIPEGWEYCTSEHDEDDAWALAVRLKARREELRPDLFVRVKVIRARGPHASGAWWILRRDESRRETVK